MCTHRRRPLLFPSGRTWHLARAREPHPSLVLVLQWTEGAPGSLGQHCCHCHAESRGGGAGRRDAVALCVVASSLLLLRAPPLLLAHTPPLKPPLSTHVALLLPSSVG
jgi:hypothetical protein